MFKSVLRLILVLTFITSLSCTANAVCEHNFGCAEDKSNLISNDDMTHYYYCLNGCGSYGTVSGGVNVKEKCTFALIFEKKSTCTENGIKLYMCTVCYGNKEEKTSKLSHSYVKTRKLPTCTQKGYDLYRCSGCGDCYTDNTTACLAHISDGGTVEVLPSYGKQGVLKVSCRICGAVIERKSLSGNFGSLTVPETVSGFKVKSSGTSSVRLAWKRNEYALYYKIYYSSDKKKWKTLSSDGNGITVKKLQPAKKYYFKISAVTDPDMNIESKILSAYTSPEKITDVNVSSARKSSASVQWKKQNRVSGYEVSYSLHKFSKGKNIEKIIVKKGTKKNIKELKSGRKYYFRIRSYKQFGSKRVYGAYSKVKTVKIR